MLSFYLSLADTPEDKDKIRGIYEKYHDLMMAVAVRFFDDRHDAEDAVHQAFLTVIKNLEKISRVDCPETRRFCVIITRSRCLDMLRSRKRDFSVENTDSVELNSTAPVDDSLLFEAETPLQKALQKSLPDHINESPDLLIPESPFMHCPFFFMAYHLPAVFK